MDLALQDPFGLAAPEALAGVISAPDYEAITCMALNRRGTLLAGGTLTGLDMRCMMQAGDIGVSCIEV